MKKIINYEKDILFKTNIGELTSISLEHDFTLDENILKGDFLVSGEYKPNELSINKESFEYRLPLEYELPLTVDVDTLSYDIDDFEYTVKDDCLTVFIDFGVRYEEKAIEPRIPDITEKDLNDEPQPDDVELPMLVDENCENDLDRVESLQEEPQPDEPEGSPTIEIDDGPVDRLDEEDQETIVNSFLETDEYITYHVHIVREGDTIDSIAEKYGCSTELIKQYNDFETIEEKMKLLIPEERDE